MLEKNKINDKIKYLEETLKKFEDGEIDLSEASKEYKKAISEAKDLEIYFNDLKNEIMIIGEDFSKE
jgi:exonuclease VII small subunit